MKGLFLKKKVIKNKTKNKVPSGQGTEKLKFDMKQVEKNSNFHSEETRQADIWSH